MVNVQSTIMTQIPLLIPKKRIDKKCVNYITYGQKCGCPFCTATAMQNFKFAAGDRIRLLSGSRAGRQATVISRPEIVSNDHQMLLVQMDDDDSSSQQMVNLRFELVEREPYLSVPSWAPPLSIRKTYELHKYIAEFCEKNSSGSSKKIDFTSLYILTFRIWNKRLPLDVNKVWVLLENHGVPLRWKSTIVKLMAHGQALLLTVNGKKPIKKYLVEPMSLTTSSLGYSE